MKKYFTHKCIIAGLVSLLLLVSCRQKLNHEEQLKYYVTVQLQVKDVNYLIKNFSSNLSQILAQPAVVKNHIINAQTLDSIELSLKEVIDQINKRFMVLHEMPLVKSDIGMRTLTAHYLKDCRDVLVKHVPKIIDSYKNPPTHKANSLIDEEIFELKKFKLINDANLLKKISKLFRESRGITDEELAQYGL